MDNLFDFGENIQKKGKKYFFVTFGTGKDLIAFLEKNYVSGATRFDSEQEVIERLLKEHLEESYIMSVLDKIKNSDKWIIYNEYELFF